MRSLDDGGGLGIDKKDLAGFGKVARSQYVKASLRVLRRDEKIRKKRRNMYLASLPKEIQAENVFDASEDLDKIPLLSATAKGGHRFTTDRKAFAQLLDQRLRTVRRLARDDPVLSAVRFHDLSDDWALTIAEALETNTHLQSLSLRGDLTDRGGSAILAALSTQTTVALAGTFNDATPLSLGKNNLLVLSIHTATDPTSFLRRLAMRPFEENKEKKIGGIGPVGIRRLLSTAPGLIDLDLSGNNAGDDGALLLADAIGNELPSLTALSLARNGLTDVGVIALVKCTGLRCLGLGGNHTTDHGAEAIASILTPTEKTLDLSFNDIGTRGCGLLTGSVALWGNPGFVRGRTTKPRTAPVPATTEGIRPNSLPLRLGDTADGDTGRNTLYLRVSTPASRADISGPGYESFLAIAKRRTEMRGVMEQRRTDPMYHRKKASLLTREIPLYRPRNDLPPSEFVTMMGRYDRFKHTDAFHPTMTPSRSEAALRAHFSNVVDSAPFGRLQGLRHHTPPSRTLSSHSQSSGGAIATKHQRRRRRSCLHR